MARTLLLCFVHGFKGDDNTFQNFPQDLEDAVTKELPEHRVQSVVYPKYETKGELAQCTEQFLAWLKERVMEIRKANSGKPWPPQDRDVGVILVAHSMGGFVASDTLFLALNERHNAIKSLEDTRGDDGDYKGGEAAKTHPPLFPLIQGIIAFDTPYNGLARSMFVYGAFSNYNKVSSVFNVMTALAAAPAGLSRLAVRNATRRTVTRSTAAAAGSAAAAASANPGWKAWQLIAVRTGTVGAIAAGGVAAYVHRRQIAAGLRTVRDLDRATIAEGYQRSVGALGQGLAYVNRGNVGKSYAWLADHFTFVGALVKPRELERRLARLSALKGVGFCDVYASLGENGYWSGGYFVPERTFCAVPEAAAGKNKDKDKDNYNHPVASLFERRVVEGASDEVEAHMSMFKPDKNTEYPAMTARAAKLVAEWFNSDVEVVEDLKFAPGGEAGTAEADGVDAEENKLRATDEGVEIADMPNDGADVTESAMTSALATESSTKEVGGASAAVTEDDKAEGMLPDESPIDIAAAASLVPLPEDMDLENDESGEAKAGTTEQEKQTYLRHLFGIAEQAGTGLRSATATWSSKLPGMEQIPRPSMSALPAMPAIPAMPSMPSLPKPSMPTFSMFSKKKSSSQASQEQEKPSTDEPVPAGNSASAPSAAPPGVTATPTATAASSDAQTGQGSHGEGPTWASESEPMNMTDEQPTAT